MADNGPSVQDITNARNSLHARQEQLLNKDKASGDPHDPKAIGQALQEAHKDAKEIKSTHEALKADAHTPTQDERKSVSDKASDAVQPIKEKVSELSETLKEKTPKVTENLGDTTQDATLTGVESVKSSIQEGARAIGSMLGLGSSEAGRKPPTPADDTSSRADTRADSPSGAQDEVLVEVGDTVDLVNRKDLEKDKPATDQRTAGDSGVAAVADDVDRAPTAKTDEPIDRPASGVTAAVEKLVDGSGDKMEMPVSDTGMPVLPSPVEGGSAQTSSVGVGDPRADSNAVVQARDAGKTIVDTIKGIFGGPTTDAPAGAHLEKEENLSDVGNFEKLHQEVLGGQVPQRSTGTPAVVDDNEPPADMGETPPAGTNREESGGGKGGILDSLKEMVGLSDTAQEAKETPATSTATAASQGRDDDAGGRTDAARTDPKQAERAEREAADASPVDQAKEAASVAADTVKQGTKEDARSLKDTLAQGWDELTHGGGKAPYATTQGEGSPQDVTSNVERSKNLSDPGEKKVYEAETYKVAPGKPAADDQAAANERKQTEGGVVAGDQRQVTGTTPHGIPDSSKVTPEQIKGDRLHAGKGGIFSSMGSGSAKGPLADDSIKQVNALFTTTAPADTATKSETCTAHKPEKSEEPVWNFLDAVSKGLRNFGRAQAKEPTGKEVKDAQKELVFEDPAAHRLHISGQDNMTGFPADSEEHQRMTNRPPMDANLVSSKVERLGKALHDTFVPPKKKEEAESSLRGKDSADMPDGEQELLRERAEAAKQGVANLPQKAASAVGTVAEMAAGVVEHVGTKASETVSNIADSRNPRGTENTEESVMKSVEEIADKWSPDKLTPPIEVPMQQLEQMAAEGDPALRRDTLKDKILYQLTKDAKDDSNAKELAKSYLEYKQEKEEKGEEHNPIAKMEEDKQADTSKPSRGGKTMTKAEEDPTDPAEVNPSEGSWRRHGHPSDKSATSKEGSNPKESEYDTSARDKTPAGLATATGAPESGEGGTNKSGAPKPGEGETMKSGGGVNVRREPGMPSNPEEVAKGFGEMIKESARDARQRAHDPNTKSGQDYRRDPWREESAGSESAKDTAESVQQQGKEAAESAKETAESARDQAKETAQHVADKTRDTAESAKQRAQGTAESASEWVGEIYGHMKEVAGQTIESVKEAAESARERAEETLGLAKHKTHEAAESARGAAESAKELAKESAESAKERAKESAESATERAKESAESAKERAKESAESAKERVKESAESAKERAKQDAESVKERAKDTVESAKDKVHQTVGSAKETAESAKDRFESSKDDAKAKAQQAADKTRDTVESAGESARESAESARLRAAETADRTAQKAHETADTVTGKVYEVAESLVATVKGLFEPVIETAEEALERTRQRSEELLHKGQHTAESAKHKAADTAESAKERVKDTAESAKEHAKETAESAKDRTHEAARSAEDRVRESATSAKEQAKQTAESAKEKTKETVESTKERARETADSAKEHAKQTADSAKEKTHETAESLRQKSEEAAEKAGEKPGQASSLIAEHVEAAGRATGIVFGGLAEAAKGVFGSLLGPVEKEFVPGDRTAATHSDAPLREGSEPHAAEQLMGEEQQRLEEARRSKVREYFERAADPGKRGQADIAPPEYHELREGAGAPAGDDAHHNGGRGGLLEKLEETVERASAKLGEVVGVTEGKMEAAQKPGEDAPNIPSEPYTNTEDLLRARQAQKQQ